MKQITIKEVKQGEFFRLTNNENAPLWVRGYYYRPEKVFEAYKYDDVNREMFAKATRRVWVEDYE